jgi:hypothetical protein
MVSNIHPNLLEKVIFNIGLNTLGLNPHLTQDELVIFLWSINGCKRFVAKPLTDSMIRKITTLIFKKREKDGKIELVPNTLVYTVYSKDCTLTKEERRAFSNKMMNEKRTNKTKTAIYSAIEEWSSTEKITQQAISTVLGKGFKLRTIKKYWAEFKDFAKTKNNEIKTPSTKVVSEDLEEKIIQPEARIDVEEIKITSEDEEAELAEYFERMKLKYKY